MGTIRRLRWDPWNVAHIARHSVHPREANEVCCGDPLFQAGYGGRMLVIGPTLAGRMLTVVIDPEGDGVYYPVTARPASRRERAVYAREKAVRQNGTE